MTDFAGREAVDTVGATPERKPGDFKRDSRGTPYVSDPTGAVVKSGARKGEPKWLKVSRPSSFGHLILSTTNLERRAERGIITGLLADENLRRLLDTATPADIDSIITRAKSAAELDQAADRGTHVHSITECVDRGRTWRHHDAAGETLGITPEMADTIAADWSALMAAHGLELVAIEATVVNDEVRVAGTLDRLVRLGRDLRIGEAFIAAGSVVVLDVKTGQLRGITDGWWQAYSPQLTAYAGARPYDCETDTRGDWPWPIDQRWGLIAHLDIAGLIGGGPLNPQLIAVDLTIGADACRIITEAKAFAARRDLFHLPDTEETTDAPADGSHGLAADADGPGRDSDRASSGLERALAHVVAVGPDPTPRDQHAARPTLTADKEGATVGPDAFQAVQQRLTLLSTVNPAAHKWVQNCRTEAQHALADFHPREAYTARRLAIYTGLLALAESDGMDDDSVRALVALATGAHDWPHFPVLTVGAVVGALDAAEAERFATHAASFAVGALAGRITDGGTLVLEVAA